jgi:hypothetical protein
MQPLLAQALASQMALWLAERNCGEACTHKEVSAHACIRELWRHEIVLSIRETSLLSTHECNHHTAVHCQIKPGDNVDKEWQWLQQDESDPDQLV